MKPRVNLITMGCSKNLVDSERVLHILAKAGIETAHDEAMAGGGTVVINTCGFIGDAKQESIDTILQACQCKAEGLVDRVIVMGCLSERYREELPREIPEVDAWYGKFDWEAVAAEVTNGHRTNRDRGWERSLTTAPHHAYVKIAEGCNRMCAFCAIPIITGRYHSRPVEEILDEVRSLVARGVKEFNIIAQDLSNYGRDLGGCQSPSPLARLLTGMSDIPGVEWIRLHYAYPADFPYDILPVMASRHNICKYIDIALQHIDDTVLANMHRHIDAERTRELLSRMRREVPGIHIRTTLMVGFPGETDDAFEKLMEFAAEQRFDRMGAFAYCEEEDTRAARELKDDIPDEVKQSRLDRLMALQEKIALQLNEDKIGNTIRVIVDSENDDYYVCRSQYDSPEVDPEVLVKKTIPMKCGEMYDVTVTDALPFELIAVPATES